MFQLVAIALLAGTVSAAPGLPALSLDSLHGAAPALLPAAPVFKEILSAPVFAPAPAPLFAPAPVFNHGPVYAPAPVFAPAPAPVFDHGPVFAPAPVFAHGPAPTIIKAAAPVIAAPVVKAVAPATSYATVTQVHVSHPQAIVKVAQPILKTIVAPQPIIAQPVFKGISLSAPEFSYGHGLSAH